MSKLYGSVMKWGKSMDLFEIEGKSLFARYEIPVEQHMLLTETADPASFVFPCYIKAQVLSGKRGKAGGILFVESFSELPEKIQKVKDILFQGKKADYLMLSQKIDIIREMYLSFTIDNVSRKPMLLFSPDGGMDIETTLQEDKQKLLILDCTEGVNTEELCSSIRNMGIKGLNENELSSLALKLYRLFCDKDALLAEINPLVLTNDCHLIALDAKVTIDDNALYRQTDLDLLPRSRSALTPAEIAAREAGLEYVELDKEGNIGVIAGGAGIGMATVDTLRYYGGKPFNFLDLGGGVTSEKTCSAMKLLLRNPKIKGILINIFGGINNCADMAAGIEKAMRETGFPSLPVVVKSRGFSQETGWKIYDQLHFEQIKYGSTDDASKLIIQRLEAVS